MKRYIALSSVALFAITGCASVTSTFKRSAPIAAPNPQLALPTAFTRTVSLRTMNLAADPILDALLNQVPDSPDVAIAEGRLQGARARLDAARAGLLPSLTASSSVSGASSKGSAGTTTGSLGSSLQVPLDIFGANRGRVSAVSARAQEAEYNKLRATALTRATLSELYVALRTAQAQIQVTRANRDSAADSLSLATARQRAGLETGLAVAQATSNRDAIAARLPGFQQAEIAARLGIEALLGQLPDAQLAQLTAATPIPRFDLASVNLPPNAWITSRADLVAAQRRLQAAGFEAGAAKRDRYPTLSLTALLSQNGASRGPTGLAGSVSANLLSTLFDFGRLEALSRVAGAEARTEAALYRQLVLNALADVETQASRANQGQASIDANNANVASAQDQAHLARIRYTSGLSGFLDVLTAERAVYEAQSAQVQATGETSLAEVSLNLALGF